MTSPKMKAGRSSADHSRWARRLATVLAVALIALTASTTVSADAPGDDDPVIAPMPIGPQGAQDAGVTETNVLGRRLLGLPFMPRDARIVFVLDGSNSVDGRLNLELKKAARRTLRLLRLRQNPDLQVGVVHFYKRARATCRLTNDERRLFGCINQVRPRLGTDIGGALREAKHLLVDVRDHPGVAPPQAEVVVLFSDGIPRGDVDDILDEARSLKANRIRVISVAVGPRANLDLLGDIASSRRDLYRVAANVRW